MRGGGQQPIIVLSQGTKRESGHQVQIGNIAACKVSFSFLTIADVIRTSLGPRAMLKMLMDPMGGIVMTNDGNAILRFCIFLKVLINIMVEKFRRTVDINNDSEVVIPRTLIQNCGGNTIRQLTALRAKHAQNADNWTWGIDGTTGEL
uniref:T-complex protein 1 subunit gamma n=1 Tax=Heterorhabditis bacteriophora TaxID=37862 RepID=A0A1I7WVV6_HETBA